MENRQGNVDERMEFRQGAYNEHHQYGEWYENRAAFAIGATLTMATFSAMSCTTTTVVVTGVSYYRCGTGWYNRAYSGGNVTYVVVGAPAGY